MNMIWHLLLKDIRRFRWWLAAWVALLGTLWAVIFMAQRWLFQTAPLADSFFMRSPSFFFNTFGSLFMSLIVIKLVQEDPLIGSTAFWLTRPIARKNLLLAKACFIFLLLFPLYAVAHWGVTPDKWAWLFLSINLIGFVMVVWIVALHTSRLSTAIGILILAYVLYSLVWILLDLLNPHKTEITFIINGIIHPSRVLDQLFQSLLVIICGAAIITYHYLTRRTTRAALISVLAGLFIVVLSFQGPAVIFPSFTVKVAAESNAQRMQHPEPQDKIDGAKPGGTIIAGQTNIQASPPLPSR